jgi:hypothetical protein
VDADPGLLGSFFVFASISGYQNVGAATTIAVLVASQLIGGLVMDVVEATAFPARPDWPGMRRGDAGDWRLAGGQTPVLIYRILPPLVSCSRRASISSLC